LLANYVFLNFDLPNVRSKNFSAVPFMTVLYNQKLRVRVCGFGSGGDSVMYQTLSLQVIF
jgi:hypothetical protein